MGNHITTIQLTPATKDRLAAYKIIPAESFESLLVRILDEKDEQKKTEFVFPEFTKEAWKK